MTANLVTTAIPAADLKKVLDLLGQVRQVLSPYLVALTPEERTQMPKMGDKSLSFVSKAAEYGASLSAVLPPYLDTDALRVDAAVSEDLLPVFQQLLALTTDVESTRMEAGSEGYSAALLVYAALQAAAKANQPGAQAAVEQLGTRFAAQRAGRPRQEARA